MARTDTLGNFLTDVADAIREKKGTEETILASDFDTEIENLPSGGGADLNEYFYTTIDSNTNNYNQALFVKKAPDIIVNNNVTSLEYAFSNMRQEVLPKVIFNNNVVRIANMFQQCSNVKTIDVSGFDTSNVTSMGYLFYYCPLLTSINLSNFDFSKVKSFYNMFGSCSSLKSIIFPNSATPELTNIAGMFSGCLALQSLDLSSFNTSNVTNMNAVFYNCYSSKMTELDLTNFDTKKVTNMSSMFEGMLNVTKLYLSSFETPVLTNTYRMFYNCKKLEYLDIRKMSFNGVTNHTDMFGASASNGVPDDCEIIVADNTQKTWVTSKFSRLTNVKTVAEYEAEQNA